MHKKISILMLSLLITLSLTGFAAAFNLPDTGQTKCYQDVTPFAEIPCAGTGQDGAYSINPMSYTDNGDGTVTDNITSLMWQNQNNNTLFNWYQASGTPDVTFNPSSQNVCGALNLGSHNDWRLPSIKELMSIADYSVPLPGPTINSVFFFPPINGTVLYWSSTTDINNTGFAWDANFATGTVDPSFGGKNATFNVRCVRGGQSAQAFVDNGNGTVTDNRTGLMWQQGEATPVPTSWGNAVSFCEGLSLAGLSDWRLPNISELESVTDETRFAPPIDKTFFPNAKPDNYWSSTTDTNTPSSAWQVNFFSVGSVATNNKTFGHPVRCVRAGFGNPNVPGAPTNVTATGGIGQATVSFTPPTNDGGSPITGYTVSSFPAGGVDSNAGTTATTHIITGLTNGITYTFTVTATNAAAATSPASSPSNSVTNVTADGDLNGGGTTDIGDALLTLRIVVGLDPVTPAALLHGDMNGDGKIDILDALLVLKRVVGLI